MTVEHLEVLVEEPSMEAALRVILPKIIGDLSFEVHSHQGKKDLLMRLPSKLSGYSRWLPETFRILVLVDRDDDDCVRLKAKLEKMAAKARLLTRARAKNKAYALVNRIAIEELEAWYFGDWEAVRSGYPNAPADVKGKAQYRSPDTIRGGTWEAFERVLQQAGYFGGGLGKIEAARVVAEHMVPSRNVSPSFCALRDVLAEMANTQQSRA